MAARVERLSAAAIALAGAYGFLLRTRALATESYWIDEVVQLRWSEGSFSESVETWWRQLESPFNMLVAWTWRHGLEALGVKFETSELLVRLPALVLGTATILVLGAAAWRAFGCVEGALAAWLAATNPFLLRYSQEARMYALTALLTAGSLFFLVRALRDDGTGRDAAAFALCGLLAALSHYLAGLWLVAGGATAAAAFARHRDRRTGRVFVASAVALLLVGAWFAAQLLRAQRTGQGGHPWLVALGPPSAAIALEGAESLAIGTLRGGLGEFPGGISLTFLGTAAAISFWLLAVVGLVVRRADEPKTLRFFIPALGLGPPIALLLISQWRPLYVHRYILWAVPGVVMLAARARPPRLAWGLAALPLLAGGILEPLVHVRLLKPDVRAAAQEFMDTCALTDGLLVSGMDGDVFTFYVRALAAPDSAAAAVLKDSTRVLGPSAGALRASKATTAELMAEMKRRSTALYLLENPRLRVLSNARAQSEAEGWKLVFESWPGAGVRLWRRTL